jgi:hypothetical protein
MSDEDGFSPCECFTVLDIRRPEASSRCDVCDHVESAHQTPGRRVLSGGEIEALRRRLIIERYAARERDESS